VLRRCHDYRRSRGIYALPPVKLIHPAQAEALEEGAVPETGDEVRCVRRLELQECFDIQVVVVIVRDEDQMDRRQIGEGESRITHASRPQMPKRTRALGIDGIRQDVESGKLDEEGNVIDESKRDLALLETLGQSGPHTITDAPGPRLRVGRATPAQEIAERAARRGGWIEKESTVKMIGRRPMISRASAERAQRIAQTPMCARRRGYTSDRSIHGMIIA